MIEPFNPPFPLEVGYHEPPDLPIWLFFEERVPETARQALAEVLTGWFDDAERGAWGRPIHTVSGAGWEDDPEPLASIFVDLGGADLDALSTLWHRISEWATHHGTTIVRAEIGDTDAAF